VAPRDGTFILWEWHHYLRYNLPTLEIAEYKLRVAVARHLCWH
jgi:hypothetical protein